MVSTLEQMQVPNGTRQGIRRSKRPLLASRTHCKCSRNLSEFGNNVKVGTKIQFGNKVTMFSEMSDQWRVSLYIAMFQNVM